MKKLKELYKDDKPREKMAKKGVKALKNEELVAVILGSGVKGKDVRKLAREITVLFDKDPQNINLQTLTSVHGLGNAKASVIIAAMELAKRYLLKPSKTITSAEDAYDELKEYADKKQEYFVAILLDGAGRIIEKNVVFIGTLDKTLIHPREIFAPAIEKRAAGIIIAHNHPSRDLTPSGADMETTKRVQKAGEILGIELIDHLIITKEGFFSFANEGMLF